MKVPHGLYVPLVTPFHADESIDYDAYKVIIDNCIDNGMDGVLIAGSTGEFHMMTEEEIMELIKKGCDIVDGRCEIVAGCSQPTPKRTIERINYAADCGADYALVLPPYYQLTTDEGVYEYFREVAEGAKIGIIVYYTPGNTVTTITPQMVRRLAMLPNIVAVKETIDELHTSASYMETYDIEDFTIMEANEPLLIPSYCIGIEAAFSIAFNVIPKEMRQMYDLVFKSNDVKAAAELNRKLAPLYTLMEEEPYPGPVKAAMDAIGLPGGIVRKPLTQPTAEMRKKVAKVMKDIGYTVVREA